MDTLKIASEAREQHYAMQHEGEFAVLLALMDCTGVSTVLEIGGAAGGSAWAFAQLPCMDWITTISLPGKGAVNVAPGIAHEIIYADSTDTLLGGNTLGRTTYDMIFIDGGHDEVTCRSDYRNFAPLCSPGGLIVFHDIHGEPGVAAVWADVKPLYCHAELGGGRPGTGVLWR